MMKSRGDISKHGEDTRRSGEDTRKSGGDMRIRARYENMWKRYREIR
jgi:hypothetical protein